MCLHQLENHEPVEFGELGVDPVERDQVTSFMLFLIFLSMKHFSSLKIFSDENILSPKYFVHHRYLSILMTLPD